MTHESRDEDVGVGVQDSGLEREVQNGLGPDLVVRQKNQVLQVRSRLQATQGHPTAKKRANEVKKGKDRWVTWASFGHAMNNNFVRIELVPSKEQKVHKNRQQVISVWYGSVQLTADVLEPYSVRK